jgi:hypothetical protein
MSSTSTPWYTFLPPWLFCFTVFANTWLQYWFKYRSDEEKAYIERHSGDDEDQVVKENVRQIKRLMDREFELQEQGLLVWLWYWPHERGLLVAIVIFVFWFVWFLLEDVILSFLLWLFVDSPLACRRFPYVDKKKNAMKWYKAQFQRQENADDVEMAAGLSTLTNDSWAKQALAAMGIQPHKHTD